MEFKKYSSITNHYDAKTLQKMIIALHGQNDIIVQEKLHGANFCFYSQNGEIAYAKRTSIIDDTEDFFKCDAMIETTTPKIKALVERLRKINKIAEDVRIRIYGELVGGNYPHKDVEKHDVPTIQRGICYAPEHRFAGFDISVGDDYLEHLFVENLFKEFGIDTAPTLFVGTLQQCLEFDHNFTTRYPASIGLPELEEDNFAEGVIIKPNKFTRTVRGERCILKKKTEKFLEKKPRKAKPEVPLTEVVHQKISMISAYVTENRLDATISKIGPLSNKTFGKTLGMFTKDVFTDFVAEHPTAFDEVEGEFSKPQKKLVQKHITTQVRQLMLEQMKKEAAELLKGSL